KFLASTVDSRVENFWCGEPACFYRHLFLVIGGGLFGHRDFDSEMPAGVTCWADCVQTGAMAEHGAGNSQKILLSRSRLIARRDSTGMRGKAAYSSRPAWDLQLRLRGQVPKTCRRRGEFLWHE